jgi:D-alanyl-lipoteichoic acid acyltransferase DltB (MBOAT superfamily)
VASQKRNRTITAVIVINLAILAFFKYFNFLFPDTEIHLLSTNFIDSSIYINKMVLPLGLSYFIFTVISYQIEIKRGTIKREEHLGFFSLFLLFFPKIAQGPIERPHSLLPQLKQVHEFDYDNISAGLKLMLLGFFKKLVVADRLGIYVNAVYENSEHHNGTTLIIATVFYAFQIYADFSGYTDIALGTARIFGINLTNNFSRPYLATSIKEFWNRWHITLSTWLRDYLFLPMAFFLSKRMKKEKYFLIATEKWIYMIASIVTFGICGLWHGEGWNYLVWGLLFGIFLTFSNWTEKFGKKLRKRFNIRKNAGYYIFYRILLVFILLNITWIFFRSDSLTTAFYIFQKIISKPTIPFFESPSNLIYGFIGIMLLITIDLKREFFNSRIAFLSSRFSIVRIGTIVMLILIILLIGVFDGGQFIYFKY